MLLAYFDPGSASLLMQALVGGGAGLVVFGRYLWASFRGQGSPVSPQTNASHSVPLTAGIPQNPPSLVEALSGEFRFNIT